MIFLLGPSASPSPQPSPRKRGEGHSLVRRSELALTGSGEVRRSQTGATESGAAGLRPCV